MIQPAWNATLALTTRVLVQSSDIPLLLVPQLYSTITQAGMLDHTGTVDLQLQKRGVQGLRRLFCSAISLMLINLVRGYRHECKQHETTSS